ncbi:MULTISPECIES: glycerol kinase GlpK [unclassified Mycoplasma]|uniref:glycerol kinase GlpK n=1 Tax=unclassified Mycoplasma TaxID=2683645 RepID=UPI00211BB15A|nr:MULTISPECIES: glycerol kinase GlpK [unclassified Mycoplasma]UUM19596.1 glycerol kinase GlpK [Mycoplasma sp. 1578d]UUM24516.1 glycerol kinase GlpK [Mycoplasma sp. 3686d]
MNSNKYIITLDEGTTSCRTIVFDHKARIVATSQSEFTQYYPQSGWVEHDALEIWNTQLSTMQTAKHKAGIKSTDVQAVGITNQRETVVLWDKSTGLPVYNAIVWQDRRTSEYCETLSEHVEKVREKTGLIINPYFSGTKIRWILKNVPLAQKVFQEGNLLAGTIDTWLIWKLTNGQVHATDVSNASRTLLFNINTMSWDQELLDLFEIPSSILPQVKSSSEIYGTINPHHWSLKAVGQVPIAGVVGDQQSALFGQLCTKVGMVKNTYGTGCFTLMNIGENPILSKNKLLTTVAWQLGNEKPIYALEGSVFIAGAAIQWIRDGLRLIYNAAESDFYANLASKDNTHQIYLVPSFTGLGAPYWDSYSRGAIFGLERGTKKEHIIKATLESIAFQSNDLIKAMSNDVNKKIEVLKVDGGASNSNYLMQFQSSISGVKVIRPKNVETTALGATFLAGLATGYWKSLIEIEQSLEVDKEFTPQLSEQEVKKLTHGWDVAIKRTFNWVKETEVQ